MRARRRVSAWGSVGIVAAGVLSGCVADGPEPPRPPRDLPPQPSGLIVDRIVMTVPTIPEDSDRNGYYDLTPVTVYLFDRRYIPPIAVTGQFEFRMLDQKDRVLATWRFDEQKTAGAQRRFMVGPGYAFELNLLDVGSDHLPVDEAVLQVTFTQDGQKPVAPRAGTSVVVGRAR
ncbi:MAG: hypothetical protein KF745_10070 [Phycisphaeraceae bacterium]|nr:hypothetical protein [Phycisphaeraceae bacterium]